MERTMANKASSWSPTASAKTRENQFAPPQLSVESDVQSKSSAMPIIDPKAAEWMTEGIERSLFNSQPPSSESAQPETAPRTGEIGLVQRFFRANQLHQTAPVHPIQASTSTAKAEAKQSGQRITINRLEQTAEDSFSKVLQCQKKKRKSSLDQKASSIIEKAKDTTQSIDKRAVQAVTDIVQEYWDASKVKEVVYRENEPGLSTTPIGKGNEIKGKIYVGSYFINNIDSFARRVLQVGHELQHVDQQRAGMGGEKNKNKREFLAFYWEALAAEKAGTGRMSYSTRRNLIDSALENFYCLSTDEQEAEEFSAKKDELLKKRDEINNKGGNDPTNPPTACK